MTRRSLSVAALLVAVLVVAAGAAVVYVHRDGSALTQSSGSTETPATLSAPKRGTFGSLAVGAGGFVTGLSFSDDGRTRLIRTDGGGAYRWDRAANRWNLVVSARSLPAADVRPDLGLGVLAVAAAPSDASRAYLAFNDAVYRSNDGARTWTRVLSGVSTAPNDSFRTLGPRLTVDPKNPDVVFYGTQLKGLLVTRDAGATWSRVPTSELPAGIRIDITDRRTRGFVIRPTNRFQDKQRLTKAERKIQRKTPKVGTAGISAVVVDPSGPVVDGRSQVLYAASYGEGIYRSSDGGRSWSRSSPSQVRAVGYMRVLDNGDLLATARQDPVDSRGKTQVWRFDGKKWSTTGPKRAANWTKLAADPTTPGRVAMLATNARLALSDDYGKTWSLVKRRTQTSQDDIPWLSWALNGGTKFMSNGEILFDPVRKGRLWFAEGTGVWYSDPPEASTEPRQVLWHSQSRGIEQLVPTDVVVPPGGKPLLTAWDRPIFRSEDPQVYPDRYGPVNKFGSAWSIDYSGKDPDYVVATVASHQAPHDPSTSGFSTNGGRSWTAFPSIPEDSRNAEKSFGFGSIAVGAPGDVVWVPAFGKRPQYTTDGGKSWQPITLPGLDDYSLVDDKPYYVDRQVITSDKSDPGTFYLFVLKTGTYRSTDAGKSWTLMSDDNAMQSADYGYAVSLKSVPGRAGELFLTPGNISGTTDQPFLHSTDAGRTWSEVSGMTGVSAFGLGKAFPGSDHAAVYAAGYLDGRYGFYRSTDDARSWTYLTDYPAGRTSRIKAIDGDKDKVGRVYAAVGGSGWVYADTAGDK